MDWKQLDKLIAIFISSGVKRMDADTDQFEHKIYWAGTIIRIDSKPKTD